MGRLTPGEFLIELDKLFSSTREKGSVYVVMKRSAQLPADRVLVPDPA